MDKYQIGFSPTEKLLRDMEKKVTFMKNIVEYAYPNTTLMKMRIPENKKYGKKFRYKNNFNNNEINNEINNAKLNEIHSQIYKFPNKNIKPNYYRKKYSNIILYK